MPSASNWTSATTIAQYHQLINDLRNESATIRANGLVPTLARLIGERTAGRLLDVGAGDGWLARVLETAEVHECDISLPRGLRSGPASVCLGDTHNLPYANESFDVTVSSLVLMWIPDLDRALAEAFRVTRPGGKLVVALTHPYFYRTGVVDVEGDFTITQHLEWEKVIEKAFVSGAVGPFRYYYRSLSHYYNSALANGWRLTAFEDYYHSGANRSSHIVERVSGPAPEKIPIFTFFCARKPSS